MKFKEGNKVEVLRRKKDPFGSWYPGKIISVDGDQYTVRYELLNNEGKPIVEKVNVEDVRPEPPPKKGGEKWVLGHIVEVFDFHSWRAGKIAKVMNNNRFVIRLFGSIQLREFDKPTLRVRQVWHNNKWDLIEKVDGPKLIKRKVTQNCLKYSHALGGDAQQSICKDTLTRERNEREEFKTFPTVKTSKRNYICDFESSPHDAVSRQGGKKGKPSIKIENFDKSHMRTLTFPKQVDVVSSPNLEMGEKCINGSFEMKVKMGKTNNFALHPSSMPVQATQESKECSVSSCSSNDYQEFTAQNFRKPRKIPIISFSDAGSSCPSISGLKDLHSCAEEELEANIHRLELHAYKSTVQALYASGPLSWEQESLLTNLRLSLNISNEEHLLQLRHLLS
ncbi:PREDICTED: uncharacterized protein LOC104613259 [Nelumbo nucifera]|uniref:Uncharacterized protein LOC104613259 n=1 Tax=Nelumbo nucifera TaxID=4432 RepID=A0A1U8BD13_NELNU|nr:PREDICTED: uncharacterized protein LOC104613259 [Nelumbo nucifera]XP_010279296.1 PREDICTED: uncharacterized protein LOC104613259 [Nelumbo nucifera]XP_010279297.1 PREDICTED: uncharacterized protein LOC104613259 [Nelumbo nucifera]